MDQKKVGQFLKDLRKDKGITQAQLAEYLGVTNRSVSRWENGATMPDFDLLLQIADYYHVDVGELLEGEKKTTNMDNKQDNMLWNVVDYQNMDKQRFSRRLRFICITGLAAYAIYMILDIADVIQISPYKEIADFMQGVMFGVLLAGILFTSSYMTKLESKKRQCLQRLSKHWKN